MGDTGAFAIHLMVAVGMGLWLAGLLTAAVLTWAGGARSYAAACLLFSLIPLSLGAFFLRLFVGNVQSTFDQILVVLPY